MQAAQRERERESDRHEEGDKQRPAQKMNRSSIAIWASKQHNNIIFNHVISKLVIRAQYTNLNDHLGQSLFFKNNKGIWS